MSGIAGVEPRRLERVLFLIQYLGRGKSLSPKASTLEGQLKADAGEWKRIAEDHLEFFRVMDNG